MFFYLIICVYNYVCIYIYAYIHTFLARLVNVKGNPLQRGMSNHVMSCRSIPYHSMPYHCMA